ncbi:MAG: exosortase A, partial [Burkholderiaceae bacterium]|nr:exosortase A [Burkholderiaceae bacterium]
MADGRLAALLVAALSLIMLFVYAETGRTMAAIWQSSDTFGHGFFVVPIALWLAWRRRSELARLSVAPFWPGVLLVAAAGFVWMLGRLGAARVVEHFALVLMLQGAVVAVLGVRVARAVAFPLLFLLFAVPFGDAFVPYLIEWTADATVLALKLTGVPVYREGNNFAIPSGQWSVIDACSGIRYLVASLMAGALFAYLVYESVWRRTAFIAASVVVPIVANWLRAYFIVLIGHLSGNELAVGVDHLVYGWIFFGFVMLLLFSIGARFREAPGAAAVPGGIVRPGPRTDGGMVAAAAMAVLAAGVW